MCKQVSIGSDKVDCVASNVKRASEKASWLRPTGRAYCRKDQRTRPRVPRQHQNLEVSGPDSFLASLSWLSLGLIWFMSNIRMFLDFVFYQPSCRSLVCVCVCGCLCGRFADSACLPNGAKWLLLYDSCSIIYLYIFLHWRTLSSYSIPETSAPLCHLHKLVKPFPTGSVTCSEKLLLPRHWVALHETCLPSTVIR